MLPSGQTGNHGAPIRIVTDELTHQIYLNHVHDKQIANWSPLEDGKDIK